MTREDIVTYVLERLGVGSSRTAFVTQIENQAFREYVRLVREFELTHETADLVFTADDPLVDLPDRFLRVRVLYAGSRRLRLSTFETVAQAEAARTSTESSSSGPTTYLFFSPSQLYLDPPPTEDDDAGGKLFYVIAPEAWTAGTDTPAHLPDDFHDLIPEACIWRMALNQEEFSGHAPAAQQNVSFLRGQLEEEMIARRGDGGNRVRRAVYG